LETLDVEGLVRLWAHEALRLFQDRLVEDDERRWTDEHVDLVAHKHFPSVDREKALKRPILYSNWLSRDYLPVDREELRGYVKARLKVFYEEELDVPLVLFNEVIFGTHLCSNLLLFPFVLSKLSCYLHQNEVDL
jgi:dynein heavy chain 1